MGERSTLCPDESQEWEGGGVRGKRREGGEWSPLPVLAVVLRIELMSSGDSNQTRSIAESRSRSGFQPWSPTLAGWLVRVGRVARCERGEAVSWLLFAALLVVAAAVAGESIAGAIARNASRIGAAGQSGELHGGLDHADLSAPDSSAIGLPVRSNGPSGLSKGQGGSSSSGSGGSVDAGGQLSGDVMAAVRLVHEFDGGPNHPERTRRLDALRDLLQLEYGSARETELVMSQVLSSEFGEWNTGEIEQWARIVGWQDLSHVPLFNGYSPVPSEGDESALHANDVDQNSLGDCYFLAGVAGLANYDQALVEQAIVDHGDGTYTVTLYEDIDGNLEPIEVTVDALMPLTEEYDELDVWLESRHTAGAADGELWPRVLEKAYAQLLGEGDIVGGYREIIGGYGHVALEALTGRPASTHQGEIAIDELAELVAAGPVLPVTQPWVPDSGFLWFGRDTGNYTVGESGQHELHTRHQHWVESVDELSGEIVVQNPWAHDTYELVLTIDEFNGAFSSVDYLPLEN